MLLGVCVRPLINLVSLCVWGVDGCCKCQQHAGPDNGLAASAGQPLHAHMVSGPLCTSSRKLGGSHSCTQVCCWLS